MPYFWVRFCHVLCRNPLILTDFYAIRTLIVWHIFGAFLLQIWGVGEVRIIFTYYHWGQTYYGHAFILRNCYPENFSYWCKMEVLKEWNVNTVAGWSKNLVIIMCGGGGLKESLHLRGGNFRRT